MTAAEVTAHLERTGALLKGHFQLSSGLHSDRYVQCALALRHPADAAPLGAALADRLRELKPTVVAGPALGGLIIAHEVARALGLPMIFAERDPATRAMVLRRGFSAGPADRVAVVEDVITTGGSAAEVGAMLEGLGATVAGYGCLVDRSGGKGRLKLAARLLALELPAWKAEECPLCRQGSAPVKPGSRPAAAPA